MYIVHSFKQFASNICLVADSGGDQGSTEPTLKNKTGIIFALLGLLITFNVRGIAQMYET